MAHYAWIDQNNVVVNVTVGIDESELINGLDTETYYSQATGYKIKRTSYNSKIRGVYAAIGFTYNEEEDIFVMPQPYPSWVRSKSYWKAPKPLPDLVNPYSWDEEKLDWIDRNDINFL
jgi:hypothetical protein